MHSLVPPTRSTFAKSSSLLASLVLTGSLASATAAAAEPLPHLVKDINLAASTEKGLSSLYQVGGRIFFIGEDHTHGPELWVSDGTDAGTHMFKDFSADNGSGVQLVRILGQSNGLLIFGVGETSSKGLWRSDGTAEGTYRISLASVSRSHMANGIFWFEAGADPGSGIQGGPWRSDGSVEGTYAIPEAAASPISPASVVVGPIWTTLGPENRIAAIGETLYFVTPDFNILRCSGTPMQSEELGDYPPTLDIRGSGNWISAFTGSEVGFQQWQAFDGNGGYVNLLPGRELIKARHAGALDGIHFAVVRSAADQRWSLWRSDGTPAGTSLVAVLPHKWEAREPSAFTRIGDKILFVVHDPKSGSEPWVTDGTPKGTRLLKNLSKGSSSSGIDYFQADGDTAYFIANNGTQTRLWKSDGTPKGTVMVPGLPKDLNLRNRLGRQYLTLGDDAVYFAGAQGNVWGPWALWKSNGTAAGTREVSRLGDGTGSSRSTEETLGREMVAFGDSVLFRAWGDGKGLLWKSDGTEAGTVPLELAPKKAASYEWGAHNVVPLDDRILFVNLENSKKVRRTLYTSDGSTSSAKLIPGIPAKSYPTGITNMVRSGEWAYLHTETHLWATRGDAESTFRLVDIATMDSKIVSTSIVAMADGILFNGQDRSLWRANAADRSLEQIAAPNTWANYPANLKRVGDLLFFTHTITGGVEIWKSDGTAQGTVKVKTIATKSEEPRDFVVSGELLWFTAITPGPAYEKQLWRSDGTDAGTFPVITDLDGDFAMPGPGPGGLLFFSLWDETHGGELWSSDGTVEGTGLLKDIHEGTPGSYPGGFTVVGDHAYFAATDPVNGRELWKSDGTTEGTVLAADLTGDAGSSSPGTFTLAGTNLFFDATTEEAGREVHVLDVSGE